MHTSRKTYIIAEAGVNHNGDMELAKQLINVAASSGADAVKFQTFRADKLLSSDAPKAAYQVENTGAEESQYNMIRKLELSHDDHKILVAHAREKRIDFLSTPFDLLSLNMLVNDFGLETIKIPSGEITNAPFILAVARVAKKLILSTGMCTLAEVEAALGVIAYGFMEKEREPQKNDFEKYFTLAMQQGLLHDRVTVLHCTTEYPAPFGEVNLRVINTFSAAFGLPVGYSDHTTGIHISLAAVALGSVMIEKHFTLDRSLPGPDHKASLEPAELQALVSGIRDIEQAMGSSVKYPTESEWPNRDVARKSLVAATAIQSGDVFSAENLTTKRPGNGLSPMNYWRLLGTRANKSYGQDNPIDE